MSATVVNVRGLALCCIPKAGGSSQKRAVLAGLGFDETEQAIHHHPALHLSAPADVPAGAFRAAFLRHPLDRLVSCWADKIARRKKGGTAGLEAKGARVGMPFTEFVELVADIRDRDVHTRAQRLFLAEGMDFLGTLEEIGEGWAALHCRFPWLGDISRHNVSPRKAGWRAYYDDATLVHAASIYGDDIALYQEVRKFDHRGAVALERGKAA